MPSQWHDINEPSGLARGKLKPSVPEKDVEITRTAPAPKKEPEIKLIKGTWLAGDEGFEFNKKCKARVEASFVREPQSKRVTVETFVRYNGDEEDLSQSVDVTLNNEGIGEFDLTLYYGQKYKQAQTEDNAEPACRYVFKATGKNCSNEIESELLDMPFLPECLKDRQEKKAATSQNAAESGSAACSGDCETCEKKQECSPAG
jgi:hypothetical protein